MNFESSCGYLICPAHLEPKGECHCIRKHYRDMAVEAADYALKNRVLHENGCIEMSTEQLSTYHKCHHWATEAIRQAFGHDEPEQVTETASKPPVSP